MIPARRPRPYRRLRELAAGIEAARWFQEQAERQGRPAEALSYSMVAGDMAECAEVIAFEHAGETVMLVGSK